MSGLTATILCAYTFAITFTNSLIYPTNGLANCPIDCKCNDENLIVKCDEGYLDVLPIALNPSIQRLIIKNNKIKTIDSSIQFYAELNYLDLSYNHLFNIPSKTFTYQRKLQELHLNHNKLNSIDNRTFIGLKELTILNLRGNFLEGLEKNIFTSLIKLEELDLGQNRLSKINSNAFNELINLRILYLDDNILTRIPTECFNSIPKLAELYLGLNSFNTIQPEAFKNLTQLNELDLHGSDLYNISRQSLKGLNSLRILNLSHNRLYRIPTVELSTLKRLEELYLGENDFEIIPESVFFDLINLKRLDITGSIHLRKIENSAFTSNSNLETLILSGNKQLTEINDDALNGLPYLKHLILKDNGINTLSEGLYSWSNLNTLDLSKNPIICDCRMLWLKDLFLMKNQTNDQIINVLCDTPEHLHGLPLKSLSTESFGCSNYNSRKDAMIGALVVGLAAIITAVVLTLYRYRRKIQEILKGGYGNSSLGHKEREYQKAFSDEDYMASHNTYAYYGIHSTLPNGTYPYQCNLNSVTAGAAAPGGITGITTAAGGMIRPLPITEL